MGAGRRPIRSTYPTYASCTHALTASHSAAVASSIVSGIALSTVASKFMDKVLLAVHAHPDDETITMGGTLARYSAEGVRTVVVTCTRGDLGEVRDPGLLRA